MDSLPTRRTPPVPPGAWHRLLAWIWVVMVVALIAHNGWVWFVRKRAPETDMLALLPADERDPAINEAVRRVTDVAQQHVIVLVGSRDWPSARRGAAAYAAVLTKHREWLTPDSAASVGLEQALAPWWAHRSVLLTAADRSALQTLPRDAWARTALQNLNSPLSVGQIGAWQDDPFGLFRHWAQAHAAETPVRPADGVLSVADGEFQYVLLPYTLSAQAFSIRVQQAVVPFLDDARRAAIGAAPGVKVLSAGLVFFAADAAEKASHEASTIGWGSLAGILLVMWLVFRSVAPIGLLVLSLAVGTLGALSVSALAFDKVHLITLVFGSSLIGVAEDYGTYYLSHRIGDNRDPWLVMRTLLPALTFALLTTAVAYLGLALTPFPGLRQMAVFSVAGLLFAWLTVALWFPWLERRPSKETAFAAWLGATRRKWPAVRWNATTVVTGVVVAAVIALGLARLKTNDDIRLLQNAPQTLINEQSEIGRILRATAPAQFYLVSADDDEAVLVREERLRLRLDSLVAKHVLAGYQAASTWVPSAQQQARDREAIAGMLYAPGGALEPLASALGEGAPWVQGARQRLAVPPEPLTIQTWLSSAISAPARHLWLGKIGSHSASVVALQGVEYASLSQLRAAAAGLPGVTWVDKVADVSSLLGRYRRQMSLVALLSFAGMWLLLLPRYGRRAWRILAPTVIGSLLALALFGLAGQPLQLFHVLATLLILAMGVDYGIFLEENSRRHQHTAWIAVVLSATSALLSFGLLGLSRTPALQSFGLTMLISIAAIALLAPCFCPVVDH